MTDYINREAANEACREAVRRYPNSFYNGIEAARDAIRKLPAADVRPVERGKWKRVVDFTGVEAFGFKETMVVGWGCNVCGYEVDVSEGSFNFCPNCGAWMEES